MAFADSEYINPRQRSRRNTRSSQRAFLQAELEDPTISDLDEFSTFIETPYFTILDEKRTFRTFIESEIEADGQHLEAGAGYQGGERVFRGLTPSLVFPMDDAQFELITTFLDSSVGFVTDISVIPQAVVEIASRLFTLNADMNAAIEMKIFKSVLDVDFFQFILDDVSFLAASARICELIRTPIVFRQDAFKNVSIGLAKTSYGYLRVLFSGKGKVTTALDKSYTRCKKVISNHGRPGSQLIGDFNFFRDHHKSTS